MDKEDMALVMTILKLLDKAAMPTTVDSAYRHVWATIQEWEAERNKLPGRPQL